MLILEAALGSPASHYGYWQADSITPPFVTIVNEKDTLLILKHFLHVTNM